MASPDAIRKALMSLMGAKKANQADPNGPNYAPDQVANPGAVESFSDINLNQARTNAQQAQGVDPLAARQADFERMQTEMQSQGGPGDNFNPGQADDFGPTLAKRSSGRGNSPEAELQIARQAELEAQTRSMELRGEDEAGRLNRMDVDAEIAGDEIRLAKEAANRPPAPPTYNEVADQFEAITGQPAMGTDRYQDMLNTIERTLGDRAAVNPLDDIPF